MRKARLAELSAILDQLKGGVTTGEALERVESLTRSMRTSLPSLVEKDLFVPVVSGAIQTLNEDAEPPGCLSNIIRTLTINVALDYLHTEMSTNPRAHKIILNSLERQSELMIKDLGGTNDPSPE